MRYFTSKEALFAAAVDVDLMLPDLSGVAVEELGARLTRHFLERWEGALSDDVLLILLRSAVTNEQVAERLRSVFVEQVVAVLAAVAPPGEAERRAALVASQLLGLALTRYLLRLPGIADPPRGRRGRGHRAERPALPHRRALLRTRTTTVIRALRRRSRPPSSWSWIRGGITAPVVGLLVENSPDAVEQPWTSPCAPSATSSPRCSGVP